MASKWNTWETLPKDGQVIAVKKNAKKRTVFGIGTYDSNTETISFEDGAVYTLTELETAVWKPNETEPNEPEREPVLWPFTPDETIEMIQNHMKSKHNVTGHDFGTNIPKGILKVSFFPGGKE